MEQNFYEQCKDHLDQPKWKKPRLMELKKRLLELDVDEDYIDKNNEFLDLCYNKITKTKFSFKNYKYNGSNYKYNTRFRSNSFDDKQLSNNNDDDKYFKKLAKNHTFCSEHNSNYNIKKINLDITDKDQLTNSINDEQFYFEP